MSASMAIGAVAGVLAAALTGPSAAPVPVAPPDGVILELLSASGSGCPAGGTVVSVSPLTQTLSVAYNSFLAQVGVGAAPADFRKSCQLTLLVHAPRGYSYAITGVDHRGQGNLETGASAVLRTRYSFTGQSPAQGVTHGFSGPLDGAWQATDSIDIASLVFSPCGEQRNLNINTDLTVRAGTSDPTTTTSFMTVDGMVGDVYRLVWRVCD